MTPSFRKRYGSTRAQDQVLIQGGAYVTNEFCCILRSGHSYTSLFAPLSWPAPRPQPLPEPLDLPTIFESILQMRIRRDREEQEHVYQPDPRECTRDQLYGELRAAISFTEDRKRFPPSYSGVPAITQRHGLWLNALACYRPDAFVLKQRLAQEAQAAAGSEVAGGEKDAAGA